MKKWGFVRWDMGSKEYKKREKLNFAVINNYYSSKLEINF